MSTTPLTWDDLPNLPDGWHWAVRDTCSGEILEDTIENNSVGGWVAGSTEEEFRVGNLVAVANGFKRDHLGDWS